jgi:hypothetical protein
MRSNKTPHGTENQETTTSTGRPRVRLSRTRAAVVGASAGSLAAAAALATFSLTSGPVGAVTSTTGILTSASTGATTSSTTGIPAGFPTGTNSGVQAGTVLKNVPGQVSSGPGWTWNPAGGGYADVTGNGANLSDLRIPGNVDVSGNNVTLNNVAITVSGGGGDSYGVDLRHTANVTIEHSNIQGTNTTTGRLMTGIKDIYGDATGTQVLANNIQEAGSAVQIFQGTIQGNYIHNFGMISTDHVNGVTTNGDIQPLLIQNNTILNKFGQTDAIGLFQDYGVVANVTVNHNLLAGGSYSLYGGEGSQGQSSNIKVTNNQFSTMYFKNGGAYGPVAYFDNQAPGNTWSGNTWSNTGKTVPEP